MVVSLISAVKAACLTYDFKPYHESSNLKSQIMVVSLVSIFKLPASSFTLVMAAQIVVVSLTSTVKLLAHRPQISILKMRQ